MVLEWTNYSRYRLMRLCKYHGQDWSKYVQPMNEKIKREDSNELFTPEMIQEEVERIMKLPSLYPEVSKSAFSRIRIVEYWICYFKQESIRASVQNQQHGYNQMLAAGKVMAKIYDMQREGQQGGLSEEELAAIEEKIGRSLAVLDKETRDRAIEAYRARGLWRLKDISVPDHPSLTDRFEQLNPSAENEDLPLHNVFTSPVVSPRCNFTSPIRPLRQVMDEAESRVDGVIEDQIAVGEPAPMDFQIQSPEQNFPPVVEMEEQPLSQPPQASRRSSRTTSSLPPPPKKTEARPERTIKEAESADNNAVRRPRRSMAGQPPTAAVAEETKREKRALVVPKEETPEDSVSARTRHPKVMDEAESRVDGVIEDRIVVGEPAPMDFQEQPLSQPPQASRRSSRTTSSLPPPPKKTEARPERTIKEEAESADNNAVRRPRRSMAGQPPTAAVAEETKREKRALIVLKEETPEDSVSARTRHHKPPEEEPPKEEEKKELRSGKEKKEAVVKEEPKELSKDLRQALKIMKEEQRASPTVARSGRKSGVGSMEPPSGRRKGKGKETPRESSQAASEASVTTLDSVRPRNMEVQTDISVRRPAHLLLLSPKKTGKKKAADEFSRPSSSARKSRMTGTPSASASATPRLTPAPGHCEDKSIEAVAVLLAPGEEFHMQFDATETERVFHVTTAAVQGMIKEETPSKKKSTAGLEDLKTIPCLEKDDLVNVRLTLDKGTLEYHMREKTGWKYDNGRPMSPPPQAKRRRDDPKDAVPDRRRLDLDLKSSMISHLRDGLMQHKNMRTFENPVGDSVEGYKLAIKQPSCMREVEKQLERGDIKDADEYFQQILLIPANGVMFNKIGVEWHGASKSLYHDAIKGWKPEKVSALGARERRGRGTAAAKEEASLPAFAPGLGLEALRCVDSPPPPPAREQKETAEGGSGTEDEEDGPLSYFLAQRDKNKKQPSSTSPAVAKNVSSSAKPATRKSIKRKAE